MFRCATWGIDAKGLRAAEQLCRYGAAIIYTTGVELVTPDTTTTRWTATSVELADSSSRLVLEFLRSADWKDLRTVRLAALHDSPNAFVASAACEESLAPTDWIDRLALSTWVVARDDDRQILALASTVSDTSELDALYIESVWVNPDYRRQGVVRSLLKLLERDAHIRGFERLLLWVLDTNESACDTYVKLNYTFDGEMKPTIKREPNGVAIIEMRMVKPLLCQGPGCPCR